MITKLNPQEIFLLERYISTEYFCELRDTWEEMVKHVEACLDGFMRNLPKNYRSRQLPEQPDVVWGGRVLPNFRNTLQGLYTGFILLTHSDYKGLSHAWGPLSDFKGQMDFWSGWMSRMDENLYGELLNKCVTLAGTISRTESAGWAPFALANYREEWGPLNPPANWPRYTLNTNVFVASGDKLERSGIYVPDVDNSCSQFLSTEYDEAPAARVRVRVDPILDPATGEKYDEQPVFEERSCTWYLVERDLETLLGRDDPESGTPKMIRLFVGDVCPETGYYFTPAKTDGRRLFEKGQVMPDFSSEYGRTIWQWDRNQT
jgi:hypothetical protein